MGCAWSLEEPERGKERKEGRKEGRIKERKEGLKKERIQERKEKIQERKKERKNLQFLPMISSLAY